MKPAAGFSEHEHTADWELEVWAADFPSLLEQAARGMFALSGTRLVAGARKSYRIQVSSFDRESLLVKFLNELLVLGEQEGLGFDHFTFLLENNSLSVFLEGAPILSQDKEIKAVTYHNLVIRETEEELRVNIVFDV